MIAPAPADPGKLRWSDMPPRGGLKPSGTLAGYHHAAPAALDARASWGERVGAWVGSNARFMGSLRGAGKLDSHWSGHNNQFIPTTTGSYPGHYSLSIVRPFSETPSRSLLTGR